MPDQIQGFICAVSATEAAKLAENLPDGAATGVAVGITREEKHLADLLLEFVSRGQEDCSGFARVYQAVSFSS